MAQPGPDGRHVLGIPAEIRTASWPSTPAGILLAVLRPSKGPDKRIRPIQGGFRQATVCWRRTLLPHLAGCQVRPNGGICSPVVRPTLLYPWILLAPSAYAHTSLDLIGLAARLHTNTDTKEPRPLEGTSALDWKADAFATHQAENISYTDRPATLPHQPPSTRAGALGTRSGFSHVGTLLIAVALGTGWLTSIRSAPVAGGTATDVLTVAVLPRFRYQTIQ